MNEQDAEALSQASFVFIVQWLFSLTHTLNPIFLNQNSNPVYMSTVTGRQ